MCVCVCVCGEYDFVCFLFVFVRSSPLVSPNVFVVAISLMLPDGFPGI